MAHANLFARWLYYNTDCSANYASPIGAPKDEPVLVFPRWVKHAFDVAAQGLAAFPSAQTLSGFAPGTSFVDIAILRFLLFAFMKAFQDRRAPWYQRGLIRKPLRKIGLILLHDVEHSFLGELAMVLGK
jgi:hypothetical protein